MQTLLENGNIEEALELAENHKIKSRGSQEKYQKVLNQVRVQAGFVCLKKLELQKPKELFINGQLDPREVGSEVFQ